MRMDLGPKQSSEVLSPSRYTGRDHPPAMFLLAVFALPPRGTSCSQMAPRSGRS